MNAKQLALEHAAMVRRLIDRFEVDTVQSLRASAPGFSHCSSAELLAIAKSRNNRRLDRIRRHARLSFSCARLHLRDTDPDFYSRPPRTATAQRPASHPLGSSRRGCAAV